MDGFIIFLAGFLFSWWFWPIVFVLSIIAEGYNRTAITTILTGLLLISLYGVFHFNEMSGMSIALTIGVYTVIGFVFSVWRWFRYVNDMTEAFNKNITEYMEEYKLSQERLNHSLSADHHIHRNHNEQYTNPNESGDDEGRLKLPVKETNGYCNLIVTYKSKTDFRSNLDLLTHWVVLWPMNALANLLSDIGSLIKHALTKFFSDLFDNITNSARKKAVVDITQE